jgi:hypothetical protein
MAPAKPAAPATPQETPEQVALAEATKQLAHLPEARRDAVATLERLSAVLGPQTEFTARSVEENIQTVPGSRIGRLVAKVLPPTAPSTASRADVARARLALPTAQERCLVAEADLADAQRALHAARHALGLRRFRDALPGVTAEVERLLAKSEALATEAAAFTTDRLLPLLEASPQAAAVAECRLTELEQLAVRAPRLRALLTAVHAQYLSTNGGP